MEESYKMKEGEKRCRKNYKFHKRTNECRLKTAVSPPYDDGSYIRTGSRCKKGYKYAKRTNRCRPFIKRTLVLRPRTPTPSVSISKDMDEYHDAKGSPDTDEWHDAKGSPSTRKSKKSKSPFKHATLPSVLPQPSPSDLPKTPSPAEKFDWFGNPMGPGKKSKKKSPFKRSTDSPSPGYGAKSPRFWM